MSITVIKTISFFLYTANTCRTTIICHLLTDIRHYRPAMYVPVSPSGKRSPSSFSLYSKSASSSCEYGCNWKNWNFPYSLSGRLLMAAPASLVRTVYAHLTPFHGRTHRVHHNQWHTNYHKLYHCKPL